MPDNTIPRPPAGNPGNAPQVLGSPWLTDQPEPAPEPAPEEVPDDDAA